MFKKIAFVGIGLALLAAPLISSAQNVSASAFASTTLSATIAGLQAEIEALLAQLQALEFHGSATASPIAVSLGTSSAALGPAMPLCPVVARSLSIGATGSDVTALQQFLAAQGYFSAPATGYFGAITQAAVAQWQAQNGVAASGSAGSGVFGPLSRAFLSRACTGFVTGVGTTTSIGTSTQTGQGNSGGGTSTNAALQFSASPQSGAAPLTVQFTATAPQGTTLGNTVNFGDGGSGTLAFVPVCSSCEAEGTVSHTYQSPGTYTAELLTGMCSCPANGICNCPNMTILGTASVTVLSASVATTEPNIEQVNAPASVTLSQGGIAEVRNESFYFTLQSLTSSSATIQTTPVGCWNSFPSDPKPQIVCMIAVLPTPPQTLSAGQSYETANYGITLTGIAGGEATFSVSAASSAQ